MEKVKTDIISICARFLAPKSHNDSANSQLDEDAMRLYNRIQVLVKKGSLQLTIDPEAIKLACLLLQLPSPSGNGKPHRNTFKDRIHKAVAAIQNLSATANEDSGIDTSVLSVTARLLGQLLDRTPGSVEAKLLVDSMNLDDFGVTGIILHAIHQARNHGGLMQVSQGIDKRDQYGYWDALLKDGFHFEHVRRIAVQRLERARQTATLLTEEIREDQSL